MSRLSCLTPKLCAAILFLICLFPSGRLLAAPQLYSIGDPTGEEQAYLEMINRARAQPTAEGVRIAAINDPNILIVIGQWDVDLSLFREQMAALPAAPPLAFNASLIASAREHSQDMLAHAYQEHNGTDGSTPPSRMSAHGYPWMAWAENIYSYAKSPSFGHAAFEIDWGGSPEEGGMQTPPSHRLTIHNPLYREIGVGVSDGTNAGVGPQVVTQDFGLAQGAAQPFLTGVVYSDGNGNGFYDAGEGIGGVTVSAAGVDAYAITASAGGYAIPLPNDGAYSVTFSGGGQLDWQNTVTVVGRQNVKLDYLATAIVAPRLANISTRLPVGRDDNAAIGGFIVTGTAPKKVIVRALGPSLKVNGTPLPGVLQNPTLELHDSTGKIIASNDDWEASANRQEISASTLAPPDARESAILMSLPAGGSSYTAIVRGKDGATGIGVVAIYDLDRTADSQLANISTRGLVKTGDDVVIGGLIVTGGAPARVLVRALGPSLPVPGKLIDPTVELFDANGVSLQKNDNWRSDQQAEIIATTIAPTRDTAAALVRTLTPGAYTAVLRGANGTSGVAVIEVYRLP